MVWGREEVVIQMGIANVGRLVWEVVEREAAGWEVVR